MTAFAPKRSVLGEADPAAGNRLGTKQKKGRGWLGVIPTNDGGVMSEKSIGVSLDGREMDIPLIVPTLNRDEIEILKNGDPPTETMFRKAIDHAKKRLNEGFSPYFD